MVSVYAIMVDDLAWMSVHIKLTARLGKLKAGLVLGNIMVIKKLG